MKAVAVYVLLALALFTSAAAVDAEEPQSALVPLSFLIGEWKLAGHMEPSTEISGAITYEWLPGGHFLVQRGEMQFGGLLIQGLELVGWDEKEKALISHAYGNLGGEVGTYRWALAGDTLVITSGEMRFEGKLSADRKVLDGRWDWKEEGVPKSYTVKATRVR